MKFSLLLMTAAVSALAVSCAGPSAQNGAQQAAAPAANPVAAQPAVAAPTPAAPAPTAAPAPAPTAAPAPAAPATRAYSGQHKTLYVTTRSGGPLNMRVSASKNAAIVASLPYRSAVAPYAEDMSGQWYQVTAENGQRGWVSSSYVTHNIPAPVAAAPAPAPEMGESSARAAAAARLAASTRNADAAAARLAASTRNANARSPYRTVTISSGVLNVRTAPSTKAGILATLPNGKVVFVSESHAGWSKVGNGWVASRYLR